MTPPLSPLSPAIFITPSSLRVTTDQDHPMFSSQHPTGYTAKTNIRNPEILNTLNSFANHLPRGECNNMDFAGSALVYLQPGLVTETSAATTDFCLFPVDIRDHERDSGGGMLSQSNVNDIKIGGWQFGAGVVQLSRFIAF